LAIVAVVVEREKMIKSVIDSFYIFFEWFKFPIFLILCIILTFSILISIDLFLLFKSGKRFNKSSIKKIKPRNFFEKLFIDFPKIYAQDLIDFNPEHFKYKGMVIFEGRQGYGKTISALEYAMRMQLEFPLAKCITNVGYTMQNDELKHWKQLTSYNNGKQGVICIIDETQNWFSSNQSKNFPPEMLETVTQNRKNKRIILGTAQSFYMLAKHIRTQTSEVRSCFTILNCITFVKRKEPILNHDGDVLEFKNKGIYFFVHTSKLRNSYDTYKVINSLVKSGFQDTCMQPDTKILNYINLEKK